MQTPYGYFGRDSFTITTPRTPRHWYNYLWNERYVSLVSQVGHGESFAQDSAGRRIPVVRARQCLVRDTATGACWSPLAQPPNEPLEGYACTHAFGSTVIQGQWQGLSAEIRFHVPLEEPCEIWQITWTNQGKSERSLQVHLACDPGLGGPDKPQSYYRCLGSFDPQRRMLALADPSRPFEDAAQSCAVMACSRELAGYELRWESYIGYGSWQQPDAVHRAERLTGEPPIMERGVLALQTDMHMKPGESQTFHVIAGAAVSTEQGAAMVDRLADPKAMAAGFERMRQDVRDELGGTVVHSADPLFDMFVSRWLKRQTALGTQWARVRHNGFRDRVQDIGAFAAVNPVRAIERLGPVLSKQYASGYAPRTWLDGMIQDKDFSDNHVWIPLALHALLMETGDADLLQRKVPFNDGSEATLYEHARRAVDFLWQDRAQHGLCRFRSGDWNDCLQGVGPRGKGVSVWLSMAWCLANRYLGEMAAIAGYREDSQQACERGLQMAEHIENAAWENDRYVRGFDDEGRVVGSATNQKGALFLTTQTWAVLAGLGKDGRAERAMDTVEKRLEGALGTIALAPAYTRYDPDIGDIGYKPAGANENGGVYLHASCFKLVADCMLKRRQSVARALAILPPFRGQRPPCEPYVFCNSYFTTPGHRYGTPGQSWGTGAAGWFYTALTHYVFGLKPEWDGIVMDPCLPAGCSDITVEREFRDAAYTVTYDTSAGSEHVHAILVEGEPLAARHLPCVKGRRYSITVQMISQPP